MVDKFREKLLWLLRVARTNGEEQLILHAWKTCIGKRYRAFKSLILRKLDSQTQGLPSSEETSRRCKSSKETEYFGVAYAKAFIQGKWQYASDTNSSEIKPLPCGT